MKLVQQIQDELLDDKIRLSSVLRKAYVLARQIGDSFLIDWIQNELNGYDWSQWEKKDIIEFPEYRRPGGQLKGTGPYNITKPVSLQNPKVHEKVCFPPIVKSIPEIESLIHDTASDGSICMSVPPETENILCKAVGMRLQLFLAYPKASFVGIVETVRNKLLQITIDIKEKAPSLEDSGTIEPSVKEDISKNVIQIVNNPQGCQFTVGQSLSYEMSFQDFKGVVELALDNKGVAKEQTSRLLQVLEDAEKESPPKQEKKLPRKILDFIKANKGWMTETVVDLIRKYWLGI